MTRFASWLVLALLFWASPLLADPPIASTATEPRFGVGLGFSAGTTLLAPSALAGGVLTVNADAGRWGAVVELRALRYLDRDPVFFELGYGGRFAFWNAETSPFVGAGFAYSSFALGASTASPSDVARQVGYGAGSYVEGGLSAFRSRSTTWSLALRAEQPWYRVATRSSDGGAFEKSWTMPIFFTCTVLLH